MLEIFTDAGVGTGVVEQGAKVTSIKPGARLSSGKG
jgi:hypothetical protein